MAMTTTAVLLMKTALETGMKKLFGLQVYVTRAHTAEEALTLMKGVHPEAAGAGRAFDVIVTDQHMELAGGAMTGSQLVEILSAQQQRQGTQRTVLCIASGDAGDDAIEWTAGADVVWPKPYPSQAVVSGDLAKVFLDLSACAAVEVVGVAPLDAASKEG